MKLMIFFLKECHSTFMTSVTGFLEQCSWHTTLLLLARQQRSKVLSANGQTKRPLALLISYMSPSNSPAVTEEQSDALLHSQQSPSVFIWLLLLHNHIRCVSSVVMVNAFSSVLECSKMTVLQKE